MIKKNSSTPGVAFGHISLERATIISTRIYSAVSQEILLRSFTTNILIMTIYFVFLYYIGNATFSTNIETHETVVEAAQFKAMEIGTDRVFRDFKGSILRSGDLLLQIVEWNEENSTQKADSFLIGSDNCASTGNCYISIDLDGNYEIVQKMANYFAGFPDGYETYDTFQEVKVLLAYHPQNNITVMKVFDKEIGEQISDRIRDQCIYNPEVCTHQCKGQSPTGFSCVLDEQNRTISAPLYSLYDSDFRTTLITKICLPEIETSGVILCALFIPAIPTDKHSAPILSEAFIALQRPGIGLYFIGGLGCPSTNCGVLSLIGDPQNVLSSDKIVELVNSFNSENAYSSESLESEFGLLLTTGSDIPI